MLLKVSQIVGPPTFLWDWQKFAFCQTYVWQKIWGIRKLWHMTLEFHVLVWDRFTKWLDLQLQYMHKQMIKNLQIRFHSKRPHTISNMNDNLNMESTTAQWMLNVEKKKGTFWNFTFYISCQLIWTKKTSM